MLKTRSTFVLIGTVLVVLFGLFLYGYLPRLIQAKKLDGMASKAELPKVNVLIATPDESSLQLILPSVTQADHVTPIWARANGYLGELLVDIGAEVEKDDMLAILETPELDQQYEEAVHNYESAKAKRDIAELTMVRNQTLYNTSSGAVAKQDLDDAVAAFLSSVADARAQEALVEYYRDLQSFKYIVAPFAGIITSRSIDIGSLITAGSNGSPQQLFEIADVNVIRVYVSVPQYAVRSIAEGVEAVTYVREYQNETFPCKVKRYAKSLDTVSHTMLTELDIDNKERRLMAGLYAEVHFSLRPDTVSYNLPVGAIIIRAGEPHVAVLDDRDIVQMKKVTIGQDRGSTMQIVDGIMPNDRIVTNTSDRIKEGVKVEVTATKAPPPIPPHPVETSLVPPPQPVEAPLKQ